MVKRQLFGTDGIRGVANTYPMTADMVLKLGQAAGKVFAKKDKTKIVIGKDTRISGYIFESSLTAGLCSMGIDVYLVGPMPTPAIAHLIRSFAADGGIVISASHNPAKDNGIKFFDKAGIKLPESVEKEIEDIALNCKISTECFSSDKVGKAFRINDASGRYIEFAKNSIQNKSLKGLKIVLDCANGAAYKVAPLIFSELGADTVVFGNRPDGMNINSKCGALHPEVVQTAVLGHGADVGIALDGDADRVILVDEKGDIVDGDEIVALCALDMKKRGMLVNDAVVVTVMSNLGIENVMKKNDIDVIRTKVGDKYVSETMRDKNIILGGEQSGHIIFSDHNTTGDGTISALQVLRIMKQTGRKLSELRKNLIRYPQLLTSFEVREKKPVETFEAALDAIRKAEKLLGKEGRVLVRYSGTSDKCRVMVECRHEESLQKASDMIVDAIKKEIGK